MKNTSLALVSRIIVRPMATAVANKTLLQDVVALTAQIALYSCAKRARNSCVHYILAKLFLMLSRGRVHHSVVCYSRARNCKV
jgi:hypothetical protein